MILLVLGILILLYALLDYKKAFMLFCAYQIFWYPGLPLISLSDHSLSVQLGFTFYFFVLFFFKNRKFQQPNIRIPYRIPMIMLCISGFATCFTSLDGFFSEALATFNSLVCPYVIMVWLMWHTLETKEDFKFLFKAITFTMLAAALLGFVEYATNTNYLYDYKDAFYEFTDGNYNDSASNITMRGFKIYSFFEHPIGAGMCFGLYSAFTLTLIVKNKEKLPLHRLALLTALLCLPCVFLTKMRSTMIFTLIACFACINFRKKKFYGIILLVAIAVIAAWPLLSQYMYVFLSLFNADYQSTAGGSTLVMRLSQLETVLNLWKMSPIAGLGRDFEDYLSSSLTSGALGYESIWFTQLTRYGLIGVAATVTDVVYSVILIPRKFHSKEIFFISLAYWVTYSVTTIPSFRISLYYLALFYFIKSSDVYKNSYEPIWMKSFRLKVHR